MPFVIARRLWFMAVVMMIAANLILLSLHMSSIGAATNNGVVSESSVFDSPVGNRLAMISKSFSQAFSGSMRSVARTATGGLQTVGRALGDSASFASQSAVSGVASVADGIGHIPSAVAGVATASSFVRPADQAKVPVITPLATISDAPAASAAQVVSSAVPPQWPLRGTITLPFGVSDWPYETVHTGIDISDGMHSPIRPFRPGIVVQVIHGYTGLGNHVVVDHGGGITSVYGHMYMTAVSVGQAVDESTVLGYEGSTGAATGIHLHFEVRLNGQPVNPVLYIPGQP